MPEYLLPLSVLHAAAPGVLDVVFGRDGSFDDAPFWRGPVRLMDGRYVSMDWLLCQPWDLEIMHRMADIDPRVPTAACRLAGLCLRAGADEDIPSADLCWEIIAEAMDNRIHPETAARMVALTLRLAQKIAALGSSS